MKTCLECIPCFFRQALEAARLAGARPGAQRKVLVRLARALPDFSMASSPPEMGRKIYKIVRQVTGRKDPYEAVKIESNRKALRLYTRLKRKVNRSRNPLKTAVELAIAGNIIDYGIKNSLNVGRELEKILRAEDRLIKKEKKSLFEYNAFRRSLAGAKTLFYLADNAGEIVFDRILIEEIRKRVRLKDITVAVKAGPSINDALVRDAQMCGLDRVAAIVTNGTDAPGTVLPLCSSSFRRRFQNADMVISKGQGNFESLSCVSRPVFFLFMAKCRVVAAHVGCEIGDIILRHGPGDGLTKRRGGGGKR
jgi:uncharacterized protein with ATP-grasp and redox domains